MTSRRSYGAGHPRLPAFGRSATSTVIRVVETSLPLPECLLRPPQRAPGEPVFVKVADVLLPGEYLATGLEPGAHEYQIVGENSRGDGPASTPTTVNVAESAVA